MTTLTVQTLWTAADTDLATLEGTPEFMIACATNPELMRVYQVKKGLIPASEQDERTQRAFAAVENRTLMVRKAATTVAKALTDTFTLSSVFTEDIPDQILMRVFSGMVYTTRTQYFWSRRMADSSQRNLDRELERGSTKRPPTSNEDFAALAIQQLEARISKHVEDAEYYEILMYSANTAWEMALEREEVAHQRELAQGGEPAPINVYTPDIDISEAAYAEFANKQTKAYQEKRKMIEDSTSQANSLVNSLTIGVLSDSD